MVETAGRLDEKGLVDLGDMQLDYRMIGPRPDAAPTIVLLHEGLGCVGLWGGFPEKLAQATGLGVFVYSRQGYGASSPCALPRPWRYMHHEGLDVTPRLLDAIGLRRGVLVGHSDGASIAAIFCGGVRDPRIEGVSLIAPHFFTEDFGLAEIARARANYATTDLRQKLARWHRDVDVAFNGWCDAWLSDDFRTRWNLTEYLPTIACPVQVVQGEADPYGTMRQVTVVEERCRVPVSVTMLPGIGHSPHREAPDATLETIARFCTATFQQRTSA